MSQFGCFVPFCLFCGQIYWIESVDKFFLVQLDQQASKRPSSLILQVTEILIWLRDRIQTLQVTEQAKMEVVEWLERSRSQKFFSSPYCVFWSKLAGKVLVSSRVSEQFCCVFLHCPSTSKYCLCENLHLCEFNSQKSLPQKPAVRLLMHWFTAS